MISGQVTSYIDAAQLLLYLFWGFFFVLVFWLHRESKREGYPLQTDSGETKEGFPGLPPAKVFKLPHGGGTRVVPAPEPEGEPYPLAATPVSPAPGAPLHPTGDPLADAVGPAAYNLRPDEPELDHEGEPKIVPLRVATGHGVNEKDPDPRGRPVIGCDGEVAGTVVDVWIDRPESLVRYLEVESGERRVLLPIFMAGVSASTDHVAVKAIRADQFAGVPGLSNPDHVTLQEEDKITAYYGGGHLYATAERVNPVI
ncbi:MAG: photosynthetic reaction center subunit H [Pseudomonadota bacterium]